MFQLTVWHVIVPNKPVKTFYSVAEALFAFNAAMQKGLGVNLTKETKLVSKETWELFKGVK